MFKGLKLINIITKKTAQRGFILDAHLKVCPVFYSYTSRVANVILAIKNVEITNMDIQLYWHTKNRFRSEEL